MKFDPQKHPFDQDQGKHRRSIRLPDYDYSQPGAYFVTMVTFRRECLFGEIRNSMMYLSEAGQIVLDVWNSLPVRYPTVTLGTAVVMPNHFHGIVIINESVGVIPVVGAIHESPLRNELPLREPRAQRRRMTLPLVIGYFKMNSAKQINKLLNSSGVPIWQRNYYEHIVRNDDERNRIHFYIESNIDNWEDDDENLDKKS
jgi:REP element-mobilizing transposase RayT